MKERLPKSLTITSIVKGLTYSISLLSFATVAPHVDTVYSILFPVICAIAVFVEYGKISIPRWLLTVSSVAVVSFFLIFFDFNNLVLQMTEALLLLLGIKLLENKRIRDYMQIYAITLFLLSSLGLTGPGIVFALYVIIYIFLLSIAFIFLTYYSQDAQLELTGRTVKQITLNCLWIPVLSIPLAAVMFVILPRSQYPLLDFLNRSDRARTGFTDTVRLGEVSGIQEDTSIIFRAGMEQISDENLYWRGITLDYFDGVSWKGTRNRPVAPISNGLPIKGKRLTQTIYLEPYQGSRLFALNIPLHIPQRQAIGLDDFTFMSRAAPAGIERRIRYKAVSILTSDKRFPAAETDRERYLQLPAERVSPRIRALVHDLTAGKSPEAAAESILKHLNNGRFKYSLQNLPVTGTPIEEFLFHSRYGNCEYFASAMAVMLRVAGIPARLVGGYRGGYYNDMGGYYLVPQKNAHVWVEAIFPPGQWVMVEPTPASEDRFLPPHKGNLALRAQILFDTISYYWTTIIINYNLERQISIAGTVLSKIRRPPALHVTVNRKILFVILLVAGLLGILAANARAIFQGRRTREGRLLVYFLRQLERRGYKKTPSMGLEEFVSTISDSRLRLVALHFAQEFEKIHYKDNRFSRDDMRRLYAIIKEMPGQSPPVKKSRKEQP